MKGGEAMREFILYGQQSKYLSILPLNEVKKLTSSNLLEDLKNVMNYSADILYCGTLSAEKVKQTLTQQSFFAAQPKTAETPNYRAIADYPKSKIIVVDDKKVVQNQINILGNTQGMDLRQRTISNAFNQYFGIGMSSLVFQEIREFRSMAYGASARYMSNPYLFHDQPAYFFGWLQTQSDKTIEALQVMTDLFKEMPRKPERLEIIKQSLIQNINTSAPTMRDLGSTVCAWQNNGYTDDPRKFQYDIYQTLTFNDIVDFYSNYIKGKPLVYTVYGDLKKIDQKTLSTFGTIETIKKKDLIKE
jgi:predicted Zn-dependent peptidase